MKKKLLAYFMFFSLFFLLSYFAYIPLDLFNIDINKFSDAFRYIYNFIMNIIFIIIIIFLYLKTLKKDIKDFKKNYKKYIIMCLKYYFIGLLIMEISNLIIALFFEGATPNNDNAVKSLIDIYPIYMFFSVSIYAPLCEEIIFRKSIKDIVYLYGDNKMIKYLYVFISALIFSSLHVIGSISNSIDYIYIVPYLALGFSFSLLYMKTDNIYLTIILHSMHNTLALILYLL